MDLIIDNKLENKSNINNEINSFINELQNSLEKDNNFQTTLTNEFYNTIPLASKYKNELENIIDDCMKNMSYDREFFYFDYDKKDNIYYLDYYSDGKIERIEMTKQDIEDSQLEKGWFYAWYNEEQIVEANSLKEGIKSNVELELDTLEFNNRKNK